MTEDEKKEVATFRFGVIGDFVTGPNPDFGWKGKLLKEKCDRKWSIPFSDKTRIGESTMKRWISLYEKGGRRLEALYPKDRSDRGKSRSLDDETTQALINLRKEYPTTIAQKLIDLMKERKLVTTGIDLNLSTVYRVLHQHDLIKPQNPCDRRKFEAALPNDLWQADVMHGPHVNCGGKSKKSYLIAIIDDHSRLIVHSGFYLSEKLTCWMHTFEQALLRRGLPRKLFVDNGAAFRSKHLAYVAASLGIALIHSRPYCPQGKGKIERWFKTVRSEFLPDYKEESLEGINERFRNWVDESYHQRKHSTTGQKPLERFVSNTQCLRTAPKNLKDHFRKAARRRVAKDRTVTIEGRLFEAPVLLIGKHVTLLFHEDSPEQVEVLYNQKSYGMILPVDVHVNCRVKRDRNRNPELADEGRASYQGGKLWSGKGGNP